MQTGEYSGNKVRRLFLRGNCWAGLCVCVFRVYLIQQRMFNDRSRSPHTERSCLVVPLHACMHVGCMRACMRRVGAFIAVCFVRTKELTWLTLAWYLIIQHANLHDWRVILLCRLQNLQQQQKKNVVAVCSNAFDSHGNGEHAKGRFD